MYLMLLALFIIVPIIEVYLFIKIGSVIGAGATIALVLLTALLGALLVQKQGLGLVLRARERLARREAPANEMFEGLCVLLAAILLLTPGFFTDTIGFILLIPAARSFIRTLILDSILEMYTFGMVNTDDVRAGYDRVRTRRRSKEPGVIDADYEVVEEETPAENRKKTRAPSRRR